MNIIIETIIVMFRYDLKTNKHIVKPKKAYNLPPIINMKLPLFHPPPPSCPTPVIEN